MQDNNTIHTLSSATINQIAAGEVVQRPASVVKELTENSIDAGATQIDIIVQDAGRTFIKVIDNGKGMSAEDSVKAFERHATSKINDAQDLFSLRTMGFRGEALASIAAVSRVEMFTKRESDELGSHVEINGGELALQEFTTCKNGTQIIVKDIFYNIPVRRKFLKKNETELRNILNVFQQVALVYPSIGFTFSHNGSVLFNLKKENFRQRIASVCGEKTGKELLSIDVDTVLAHISGFVSTPASAVKKQPSQYFFVNGRYIQHPYFAKAVAMGYDKILPQDSKPQFFLYFDIEPDKIDVNIHPTKTEVKFEDEQLLFPIIVSAVKEALASSCSMPSLMFDQEDKIEIPVSVNDFDSLKQPPVTHNHSYNPFSSHQQVNTNGAVKRSVEGWENLYSHTKPTEMEEPVPQYETSCEPLIKSKPVFNGFTFDGKYIVCASEKGLMIINAYRASVRVLYDKLSNMIKSGKSVGQSVMFPEVLEFNQLDNTTFKSLKSSFEAVGYKFEPFGQTAWQITAVPSVVSDSEAIEIIKDLTADSDGTSVEEVLRESMLVRLAEKGASKTKSLTMEMASELVEALFNTEMPAYTPQGNAVYYVVDSETIKNKIG